MNFNQEFNDGFSPINEGNYDAVVSGAEFKVSKAGNDYLSLVFKVDSGRLIFDNFNLFHDDQRVRNIAMGKMKRLLNAVGVSSNEMENVTREKLINFLADKRVQLVVGIKEDKNIIKGFNKCETETSQMDEIPF